MKVSQLAQICNLEDNRIILYGYTYERETVYVYIEEGKLIRVTEKSTSPYNTTQRIEMCSNVLPYFFGGVKRWYMGATNLLFKDLYNSISSEKLCETGGGEHHFSGEIAYNLEEAIYVDGREAGT